MSFKNPGKFIKGNYFHFQSYWAKLEPDEHRYVYQTSYFRFQDLSMIFVFLIIIVS